MTPPSPSRTLTRSSSRVSTPRCSNKRRPSPSKTGIRWVPVAAEDVDGHTVVMVAVPAARGFEAPASGNNGPGGHELVVDLAVRAIIGAWKGPLVQPDHSAASRGTSATDGRVAPCTSWRTGGPAGTSGTPTWASRSAQSGGAHTRTSAPSSRNRTASPASGSTSPRPPVRSKFRSGKERVAPCFFFAVRCGRTTSSRSGGTAVRRGGRRTCQHRPARSHPGRGGRTRLRKVHRRAAQDACRAACRRPAISGGGGAG